MLILMRRPQESIQITGPAVITVVSVDGKYVRIGFNAPDATRIVRTELGEPRTDGCLWAAHRDRMIAQMREAIEWLGGDTVVDLIREHWPGELECEPLTPEMLGALLDQWTKPERRDDDSHTA